MSLKILHASDVQFGRPYRPDSADALVALAHELSPDVVVVAGDLTQRAKVAEFVGVRRLLGRLPAVPCIVTPGNHDVPLYRFWERAFNTYRNWRRAMGPDLDTVTRMEGATIVALNSSAPRRAIVSGRIDRGQLDFARRSFETTPTTDARVVVIHHHFVATPDREGGRVLPGGARVLGELERLGVHLVLGGHVHQTHLSTSRSLVPGAGRGIPLVACGTTTSRRGRGPEAGHNTLNVVTLGERVIEVVPHRLDPEAGAFRSLDPSSFPRPGVVGATGVGA